MINVENNVKDGTIVIFFTNSSKDTVVITSYSFDIQNPTVFLQMVSLDERRLVINRDVPDLSRPSIDHYEVKSDEIVTFTIELSTISKEHYMHKCNWVLFWSFIVIDELTKNKHFYHGSLTIEIFNIEQATAH